MLLSNGVLYESTSSLLKASCLRIVLLVPNNLDYMYSGVLQQFLSGEAFESLPDKDVDTAKHDVKTTNRSKWFLRLKITF